jgi:hypothetical protein
MSDYVSSSRRQHAYTFRIFILCANSTRILPLVLGNSLAPFWLKRWYWNRVERIIAGFASDSVHVLHAIDFYLIPMTEMTLRVMSELLKVKHRFKGRAFSFALCCSHSSFAFCELDWKRYRQKSRVTQNFPTKLTHSNSNNMVLSIHSLGPCENELYFIYLRIQNA